MDKFFQINWQEVFIPSLSIAELILRGSLVYLALFSVLRLLPSRQLGNARNCRFAGSSAVC